MQIEQEYRELYIEIDKTFDVNSSSMERAAHSIELARLSNVDKSKIINDHNELDDLFG